MVTMAESFADARNRSLHSILEFRARATRSLSDPHRPRARDPRRHGCVRRTARARRGASRRSRKSARERHCASSPYLTCEHLELFAWWRRLQGWRRRLIRRRLWAMAALMFSWPPATTTCMPSTITCFAAIATASPARSISVSRLTPRIVSASATRISSAVTSGLTRRTLRRRRPPLSQRCA